MEKLTTKEKISIMQAYLDGKVIQFRLKNENSRWKILQPIGQYCENEPGWDFSIYDYRLKPDETLVVQEPPLRQYQNEEEFVSDLKKHGPMLLIPEVKDARSFAIPLRVSDCRVYFENIWGLWNEDFVKGYSFEELLVEQFKWQDGTPCGVGRENMVSELKPRLYRAKRSYDKAEIVGQLVFIENNPHIIRDCDIQEDGHHFSQASDDPTWVDIDTIEEL